MQHTFHDNEIHFYSIFDSCACPVTEILISRFRAIIQVMFCSMRYVLEHIYSKEVVLTHVHLLSKRNSPLSRVVLLNFIYLHLSNYLLSCLIPSFKLYRYMNTPIVADPQRKNELGRTIRNRMRSPKNLKNITQRDNKAKWL